MTVNTTGSVSTQTGEAAVSLKEADLPSVVLKILKNEETAPELLCNTLTLLRTLGTAGRGQQWSCLCVSGGVIT